MPDGLVTELKTTDRYLAAYLFARKYLFLGAQPASHGKLEFRFAMDETIAEAVQDFHNNLGDVPPQDFCRGLETISSLIRQARETARRAS